MLKESVRSLLEPFPHRAPRADQRTASSAWVGLFHHHHSARMVLGKCEQDGNRNGRRTANGPLTRVQAVSAGRLHPQGVEPSPWME